MNGIKWQQKTKHLAIALGIPLTMMALVTGCKTEADRNQVNIRPVSSDSENGTSDMQERRGIVGEVISIADGGPVVSAKIDVKSLDEPAPPIPERIVYSDNAGHYYWPLKPGRYQLTAHADGYQAVTSDVDVGENGQSTLDFALEKER